MNRDGGRARCPWIPGAVLVGFAAVVVASGCRCAGDGAEVDPAPQTENRAEAVDGADEIDIPREHRLLLVGDLHPAAVKDRVAQAARRAELVFVGRHSVKCRRVELLDVAGPPYMLRGHGFSLRARRKLDERCAEPRGSAAISFNRRVTDRSRALGQQNSLAPADDLTDARTKRRLKHITASSARGDMAYYWSGGTVAGLDDPPADLAALHRLFPIVGSLDGYDPTRSLRAVGDLELRENNFDLGTLSKDGHEALVELALWRVRDASGKQVPLASELLYPAVQGQSFERFAAELRSLLAEDLHWAETRESLVYDLAEGRGPGRSTPRD